MRGHFPLYRCSQGALKTVGLARRAWEHGPACSDASRRLQGTGAASRQGVGRGWGSGILAWGQGMVMRLDWAAGRVMGAPVRRAPPRPTAELCTCAAMMAIRVARLLGRGQWGKGRDEQVVGCARTGATTSGDSGKWLRRHVLPAYQRTRGVPRWLSERPGVGAVSELR